MRNLKTRCLAVWLAAFVIGCATPIEIPLHQDGSAGTNNPTNNANVDLPTHRSDGGASDSMQPPPADFWPTSDAMPDPDSASDASAPDNGYTDGSPDAVVDGTSDAVEPDAMPDSQADDGSQDDVGGNEPDGNEPDGNEPDA